MEKEKKPKHFIAQPTYPGGSKAMTDFIYKNLRFPKLAAEAKLEGMVFLRYDIDDKGRVTDVLVIKSLGKGCDEEAVRVTKMLRFDVPKNRGLRVTFHKNLRIQFKMAKPVEIAPPPILAQPQVQMQLNYTVTTAEKAVEKTAEKPKPTTSGYSISYTISRSGLPPADLRPPAPIWWKGCKCRLTGTS